MDDHSTHRLTDRRLWVRLLYMLFFAIAYSIAETLVWLVALFQFVVVLFTRSVHDRVLHFSRNLNGYVFEVLQFLTFNDERLPFPFSEWPDESPGDTPWREAPSAQAPDSAAGPAETGPDQASAADPSASAQRPVGGDAERDDDRQC